MLVVLLFFSRFVRSFFFHHGRLRFLDEDKLELFVQRGKAFGLQDKELMDYVDKQIRLRKDRIGLFCVKRRRQTVDS